MKTRSRRAAPHVSVRWLKALIARHREADKDAVARRVCRYFNLPKQISDKLLTERDSA